MIGIFTSNLWWIMPALWACFIAYAIWYFTKAKRYAPITLAEAKQLWTIHYRNSSCGYKKWRQIRHRGKTVGFECGCGYKHLQERPIAAHGPPTSVHTRTPAFNTLRPSSRSS